MPYIEGAGRNQRQMFPEYIEDYIDENNTTRVIDVYVDTLDLREMGFTKSNPYRKGAPAYNPKDNLKLYIYGYMNGIRSSRKLERLTKVNIEVIWLLKKLQPDFKTIADFRKENKDNLKKVFKSNLYGKEMVAVDGTKFRADNSKKNNFNIKKIDRHKKYIDEKIEEYMNCLDENDKNEENDQSPEKLKYTVDEIKEKIKTLKERRENYDELEKNLNETGETEISTTDPDARLMDNKKNGLEVNYNVQIAVDSKNKLIVANEVTNNPADQGHLNTMVQAAKETMGMEEKETIEALADKGYYQGEDLIECDGNGTITYVSHQEYSNATGVKEYYSSRFRYDAGKDVYICPEDKILYRTKHRTPNPDKVKYKNFRECKKCPNRDKCTKSSKGRIISRSKHQDFLDIVNARTKDNIDKYKQRQMIVEHPFGTVKRSMNAGYFLTRGLASVNGESNLVFLAYNMKKVINILGVKEMIRRIEERASITANYFHKILGTLRSSRENENKNRILKCGVWKREQLAM
jgi:transposase